MDFITSIILDNSPPDATFFNSPYVLPLFAEKRKLSSSLPFILKFCDGLISILKVAEAMPREASLSCSNDFNLGMVALRFLLIFSAGEGVVGRCNRGVYGRRYRVAINLALLDNGGRLIYSKG